MAARVQGDRHHAVHVVMQSQRVDRPSKQRAQDTANCQLAAVLEQLDEVIHRKCVGERGQAPLDRMRTLEQHLRIRRQGRLAASAQIEAGSLARPAAQHAARGKQPPADGVETPVNLRSSHWLTVARGALNTAGDRIGEHPRSARRRQPAFLTQNAGFTMSPKDLDHLGEVRTDWTLDEVRALLALPFNDLLFHAQRVHRRRLRPEPGPGQHPAVDQDRRMPGGLRLLPAERALRDHCRARRPDGPRRRRRCGPRGAAGRRDPFLHGRRVPQSEAEAARAHQGDGPRSAGARPRDLRDARHADAGAGASNSRTRASITTTTTSTRPRRSTARSSRPARTRTGWTRSRPCAPRA